MQNILNNIESKDITLVGCIEYIGKALREDYNDEAPMQHTPGKRRSVDTI